MIIISHRGYWKTTEEKNTKNAFVRSFNNGYGTETDVRDCKGKLLISHDMPSGDEISLRNFLEILSERKLPLAMNIKSDGQAIPLRKIMLEHKVQNWFVFDMSVPDLRSHLLAGNPVFTRMSEVELEPAFLNESHGVWLDMFNSIWYDTNIITSLLNRNKQVCIVSPELHGRDHSDLWNMLKPLSKHPQLMLCTDKPEDASSFFIN